MVQLWLIHVQDVITVGRYLMIDLSTKFGVHLGTLGQAHMSNIHSTKDRVLLYDGDGACYMSTASVAKIETALRRVEVAILENMALARCSKARVHLTPRNCFKNGRHLLKTAKPYQANRSGKSKPPLLEVLRSQMATHFENHKDIEVIAHYDIEADDGLMIDAFSMPNGCMISPDKDLRINPHEYYDLETGQFETLKGRFGWIERKQWFTPSLKPASKVIGRGTKFFLAQMLMGDLADNVQGIKQLNGKLIGEAGTIALLDPINNEDEAVNIVIDGYRAIKQNVVAEGEALWLLRNRDDNVIKYFLECNLTPLNKEFVLECSEDYKHDLPN